MRLEIFRRRQSLHFTMSLALCLSAGLWMCHEAQAQQGPSMTISPQTDVLTPQSPLLAIFPQLKPNAAHSVPLSQQYPLPNGHGATTNTKVVPYSDAMKLLQQRDATTPKAVDVDSLVPASQKWVPKTGVSK